MKGLRIKYIYKGEIRLSGLIRPEHIKKILKQYKQEYGNAEIVDYNEIY